MTPLAWNTGPIPVIEEAKNKSDWPQAIVLSAIHLERYGYFAVKEHLESLGINCNEKSLKEVMEYLHLNEIALFLLAVKRIDYNEFLKIRQINSIRNKFMHRRETYNYKIGTRAKREYEPLVNEAIRILKEKLNVVKVIIFK